jgi:hypothetical protein
MTSGPRLGIRGQEKEENEDKQTNTNIISNLFQTIHVAKIFTQRKA